MTLKEQIEHFYSQDPASLEREAALRAFNEFKFFLNQGEVRAAAKSTGEGTEEGWIVNSWVKKGSGARRAKVTASVPA